MARLVRLDDHWSLDQQTAVRDLLRDSRQKVAATQGAIADAANVSLRTLAMLESPEQSHRPRREILVRLAFALGIDPRRIQEVAGYSPLTQDSIRRLGMSVRRPTRLEADPREFFEAIGTLISPAKPALFCVAYSSPPGSAHRSDVKSLLVELINRGLWLAMVIPYPIIEAEKTTKPNLVNFYTHVYGQVIATAYELSQRTSAKKRKQIAVFVPKVDDLYGATTFALPPISSTESRSSLIKWYGIKDEHEQFELGAWVTFAQDRKDRWYTVFSRRGGHDVGGNDLNVLPAWKDYFRDIIEGCDPPKGRSWSDEMDVWARVKIQER